MTTLSKEILEKIAPEISEALGVTVVVGTEQFTDSPRLLIALTPNDQPMAKETGTQLRSLSDKITKDLESKGWELGNGNVFSWDMDGKLRFGYHQVAIETIKKSEDEKIQRKTVPIAEFLKPYKADFQAIVQEARHIKKSPKETLGDNAGQELEADTMKTFKIFDSTTQLYKMELPPGFKNVLKDIDNALLRTGAAPERLRDAATKLTELEKKYEAQLSANAKEKFQGLHEQIDAYIKKPETGLQKFARVSELAKTLEKMVEDGKFPDDIREQLNNIGEAFVNYQNPDSPKKLREADKIISAAVKSGGLSKMEVEVLDTLDHGIKEYLDPTPPAQRNR